MFSPASNILCFLGFSMAGEVYLEECCSRPELGLAAGNFSFQHRGWVSREGKRWRQRLGFVSSSITTGSVILGPEVLKF